MRKIYAGLSAVALAVGLTACSHSVDGNKQIVTQARALTGFDQVDVEGAYQVDVTTGVAFSVQVMGDSNLLDDVITKVDGDTLEIHTASNANINPSQAIHVEVTMPDLEKFSSEGSSIANLKIQNKSDKKLEVDSSGSSEINLQGSINKLNLELEGSTQVNAKNLQVSDAEVKTAGSSQVTLNVSHSLEVDAVGSSNIQYYGSPKMKKLLTTGSAVVSQGS